VGHTDTRALSTPTSLQSTQGTLKRKEPWGPVAPGATRPARGLPLVKRVTLSEGSSGEGPVPAGAGGDHALPPRHTGGAPSAEQSSAECNRLGGSPEGPCGCARERAQGSRAHADEEGGSPCHSPSNSLCHSQSHSHSHNHSHGNANSLGPCSSQSHSNPSLGSHVTVLPKAPLPTSEKADADAPIFPQGLGTEVQRSGLPNGTGASWHLHGASWLPGTRARPIGGAQGSPRLEDRARAAGG